jgi:AcrR family transcriptional regulator
MKVTETDPRSIRTRERLRLALIQLVSSKNSSNFTIQDITREAGLNRTTFYLHYQGMHELLEDCAHTLFAELREEVYSEQPLPYHNSAALKPFVKVVFLHLERHEQFYRAMLGKHGDPMFRTLFQELISELIFEPVILRGAGRKISPGTEMLFRFFSDGCIGVAIWWLESGRPISADNAAKQIARDILPDYIRLVENGL